MCVHLFTNFLYKFLWYKICVGSSEVLHTIPPASTLNYFHLVVDFLDTGQQAQNRAVLSLKGSVDGSPVDLNDHGVLPYCDQASPVCTLECRVTFETIHSPSYYINGSCFPAGGNTSVKELEKIGVNATHAHPNYLVKFPCRAISEYTCYMNETVYTQVDVRPGKSFSTRWQACMMCYTQSVLSLGKHK